MSCSCVMRLMVVGILTSLPTARDAVATEPAFAPITFEKLTLTDRYYCDGIAAGDINRDGDIDIVAGPFWYAGPDFKASHEIYPPVPLPPEKSPSDSMFSFVYDFDGDGWLDVLVLGRIHFHVAYWYQNPGKEEGPWRKHRVFERVRGESPEFADIDGDGKPELLCHWEGQWGWLAPDWSQPTAPWAFHAVGEQRDWNQFYHGEGIGDVNGDGRMDIVLNDGWYEQPPPGTAGLWKFHEGQLASKGGAQILLDDVDGDGDIDLISSLHAHAWGLAWFEQLAADAADQEGAIRIGDRLFLRHLLMGDRSEEAHYGVAFSQPHALALADLDGDGRNDFVTGKRMWAHGPYKDEEPMAPPVLYWFRSQSDGQGSTRFVPYQIDDQSGVGTQLTVVDVNKDGRPDILTVSKLGTFVFLNRAVP
ncbi:FG-GAP repeat domain-containing protein [Planctomicrobium sp. SH664]|uniref:FG-GAP repeat domain-containing protein n=1 Tax=Planctomicrobium sp. SH664 TaxID=3448125 RepID=UPI003F5BC4DD